MVPDATDPGAVRRKTLDDIRREIDAEFAAVAEPVDTPERVEGLRAFREDVVTRERRRRARRRHRRVFGYLAAGVIGAVVGQAALLVYLGRAPGIGVLRPRTANGVPAAAPAERLPATAAGEDGGSPSAPPGAAAANAAIAAAEAPPSPATAPAREALDTPSSASADDAAPTVAAAAPSSRAVVAAATAPRPTGEADAAGMPSRRRPGARAAVPPAPPAPVATRSQLAGPADWAQSQAEVRAALNAWLAAAEGRFVDVRASEAEVVLGADGRSAKTRVGVRELRWERSAEGWRVVGERDVGASR